MQLLPADVARRGEDGHLDELAPLPVDDLDDADDDPEEAPPGKQEQLERGVPHLGHEDGSFGVILTGKQWGDG